MCPKNWSKIKTKQTQNQFENRCWLIFERVSKKSEDGNKNEDGEKRWRKMIR